ncbi:MAG TPA: RloB family protein [Cyclobacteriaceae bacterium]
MKRNKHYVRRDPNKEGKLYFIFCEGERRETTYFYFFNRIASQIIVQIVPIEDGRNSPMGLYRNACQNLIKNEENPNPSYSLNEDDEVWFVIDTDQWGEEINELRQNTANHTNWFVAESNPCFEVWLYYHFREQKPDQTVNNWKTFLGETVKGGFNSGKHPVHIQQAIVNSEATFSMTDDKPDVSTTELFKVGKRIMPLVKEDIDALLKNGQEN